jgi:hypothetical protein
VKPYEQTRWARKSLLHLSSILVCYLTQTLTTLDLHENQIEDKGAQCLGEALRTNTVSEEKSAWSIFYSCLLFNTGTYYTQPPEQSNPRERSTISGWSLTNKHGERERVCLIYLLFLFYLTQALTVLDLNLNKIGEKGAHYLGEALRTNTVSEKESASSIYSSRLLFNTVTYYTQPRVDKNWRQRGTISGRSLANKHGEWGKVCFIYLLFLFVIWHRHLLNLISGTIKSETKGHNIWEKPCEQTRWARKSLLHLSSLLFSFVI